MSNKTTAFISLLVILAFIGYIIYNTARPYGDVACYDAMKGDTLWTHYFMEQFYSSPIIADGKVYLQDRNGTMHIVKAGKEYEFVAVAPLGEPVDCTPAFSDQKIFIRGRNNLYCIAQN